jgi:hypothetical protein
MDDNWKMLTAEQLLARVPERFLDTPLEDLDGQTPRQAARHVREYDCWGCKLVLRHLWEAA